MPNPTIRRASHLSVLLAALALLACGEGSPGGAGGAAGAGGQAPLEVCPDANRATLHLTLLAEGTTSTAEDRLSYALFHEWPVMSAPARAEVIPGDQISFPHVLTDVRVPPTGLSIYACFDPGSDNPIESVCTDNDLWAVHDGGAPVTFQVGFITKVELDLAAGTGRIVSAEDAADYGCAAP